MSEAINIAALFEECCGQRTDDANRINMVRRVNYAQARYPKNFKWKPKFLKKNGFKNRDKDGSRKNFHKPEKGPSKQFTKGSERRCYKCQKIGHIAKDCRVKVDKLNEVRIFDEDHCTFTQRTLTRYSRLRRL